jgi:hypothetical protein
MGFSRIALGVHSFNQVLYGWLWGIWLSTTGFYCVRSKVIEWSHKYLAGEAKPSRLEIDLILLAQIVVFVTQVVIYYLVNKRFKPRPEWTENILSVC